MALPPADAEPPTGPAGQPSIGGGANVFAGDRRATPSRPSRRRSGAPLPRLGIFGLFGIGNFGNEATLTAVLDRVDRKNKYDVLIIAEGAERVTAERGIRAVRLAPTVVGGTRKLLRFVGVALNRLRVLSGAFRTVADVDAVLVGGCGVWERLGEGPFALPYELWTISLASRFMRRPLILLDIGVERLETPLSRYFVRATARRSQYRSYRDKKSRAAMVATGVTAADDPVVADLAFGLRAVGPDTTGRPDRAVVIGVMAYYGEANDRLRFAVAHAQYIDRTAAIVAALIEAGSQVTLMGGDEDDLSVADEILERLSSTVRLAVAVSSVGEVDDLVALIRQHSVAIAVRYHNLIMAMLSATPVISIGYAPKHGEVMRAMGLDELICDVDEFDANRVVQLVEKACNDRDRYVAGVTEGVKVARQALDAEWPAVERAIRSRQKPRGRALVAGGAD